MEWEVDSPYSWNENIPFNQGVYPINDSSIWPYDLARLRSEEEVLEIGLANCVTYLLALRKKQARNQGRLTSDPSISRKRKKKLQHSKHVLEREIKHREQDEQAFLNNLQACKVNIYMAETLAYPFKRPSEILPDYSSSAADYASTVPEYTSGSTRCSFADDSEPTEFSWNGWTDDAVVSAFLKESTNPFFNDEIAPDDCSETMQIDVAADTGIKRPPPLLECPMDDDSILPVPPNTARPEFPYPTLSPAATTFEPYLAGYDDEENVYEQEFDSISMSPTLTITGLELMDQRRMTDAGISHLFQLCGLQGRPLFEQLHGYTWCNTTPERSPVMETAGRERRRDRANSY